MARPLELAHVHPLVLGLLEFMPDLPTEDGPPAWPLADYEQWLHVADQAFRLLYCLPMPAPSVEHAITASTMGRSDATELTYLRLLADEMRRTPGDGFAKAIAAAERRARDRLTAALESDVPFPATLDDLPARPRTAVDRDTAPPPDRPARRPGAPDAATVAPPADLPIPAGWPSASDGGRRAFTDEHKRAAVALAEVHGIAVTCRALDLSESVLRGWRQKAADVAARAERVLERGNLPALRCPLRPCPTPDQARNRQGLVVHLSNTHGLKGPANDDARNAAIAQAIAVRESADAPPAPAGPPQDLGDPEIPGEWADEHEAHDDTPPDGADVVKLGPTVAVNRETAEHLASLDPTRQAAAAQFMGELADAADDLEAERAALAEPEPGTSSPPQLAAVPDPVDVDDPAPAPAYDVEFPDNGPKRPTPADGALHCDLDDERDHAAGEVCAYTADDADELDRHLRRRHGLYAGDDPDDQEFRADKVRERLAAAGLPSDYAPRYTRSA